MTETRDPFCDDTAREAELRMELLRRVQDLPPGHSGAYADAELRTKMRLKAAAGEPEFLIGERAAWPVDGESLTEGGQ